MLRTLGASRRQILSLGGHRGARCSGSSEPLAGIAGGIGFAFAINELFKAVGIDLPNTGTVIETRTVIVSLIVGLVVTVARRAESGAARHAGDADGGAARGGASGHEEARPAS